MKRVAVIGSQRTPFVRSFGSYKAVSTKELLEASLVKLVESLGLEGRLLDDVIGGAVIKSTRDFNLVREAVLSTKLDPNTPGLDIQRACGTSLEAAILVANKIKLGQAEVGIACGSDSNSASPLEVSKPLRELFMSLQMSKSKLETFKIISRMRPGMFFPSVPTVNEPRTKKSMGEHCELMAKTWNITREQQDKFALKSQKTALAALNEGFFKDLVFEYKGFKQDQFIRPDSSLEKMASLKPAFDKVSGTLTAANSTPLTDGSSATFLCSEDYARKHNHKILAFIEDGQTSAVDFVHGAGLLMAPTKAVASLIQRQNMKLQDFQVYEIHEAFAAQVLSTLKAWNDPDYCKNELGLDGILGEIDLEKLNIKGGSLALGHPFAATGARLIGSTAKILSQKQNAKALVTACTAGGMGVAMIMSSPS
jgi:acetyl-CoA C-acetyltransferase